MQFWKDKNVFVTGPLGLLGPWLIEQLVADGASVVTLVRDQVPSSNFYTKGLHSKTIIVSGDLLDLSLLQRILNEYEIDSVFHLGAQAIVGCANRSPLSTFKSNIEGTWNLLEACRFSPWVQRIVVASSDKAYGQSPQLPYKEDMPLQGRYPYDVSKSCTDLLAQSYVHTYKLPLAITRCGNFFGGGDLHFNRLVPGTMRSIINGERPIIRSNGLLVRDYIYVEDVVAAYLLLAEKMDDPRIVGQAFNFSTDAPFTVIDLIDEMLNIAGRTDLKPIIENRATNEIENQHLCSEKARSLLGWQPRYGVVKGLEESFDWYRNFFDDSLKNVEKEAVALVKEMV
jgi:CDP-glucose 4,6-dehydratase